MSKLNLVDRKPQTLPSGRGSWSREWILFVVLVSVVLVVSAFFLGRLNVWPPHGKSGAKQCPLPDRVPPLVYSLNAEQMAMHYEAAQDVLTSLEIRYPGIIAQTKEWQRELRSSTPSADDLYKWRLDK